MFLIESYKNKQAELQQKIVSKELKLDFLPVIQELNYRVFVLETLQSFCKTAPVTLDKKALSYHYQLMSASLRSLVGERRFGLQTDDESKQKRVTAATSLENVVSDGLQRFKTFEPVMPEDYKNRIYGLINAVLTVWVLYRNTYVNI